MNCKLCNRCFSSKQNLNYHLKNMVCQKYINHVFKCFNCNKKFKTNYELNRHIKRSKLCNLEN